MKTYYVYIMASKSGTLYVGMTNNIKKRVYEHKTHQKEGFSDKCNVDRLLYFERFGHVDAAIKREKQIKSWRREKKIKLIDVANAGWEDISSQWY